jgi:hypothetical protein
MTFSNNSMDFGVIATSVALLSSASFSRLTSPSAPLHRCVRSCCRMWQQICHQRSLR